MPLRPRMELRDYGKLFLRVPPDRGGERGKKLLGVLPYAVEPQSDGYYQKYYGKYYT